ncbi:MAG: asparagine synthase (glutamine-hydrolyzing) [Gemmataceae bacterium]
MCGIAGLIGVDPDRAADAAPRMRRALAHRGPDADGAQTVAGPTGPPAVLVHTRLAILDLSPAGCQPMRDHPPDGPPNWIGFNGEVFNYQDLHAPLAAAGWPCRTRSDTEVILHAYRAWGDGCVERFRGMFAWCLLDPARGTAWLCRDRLGVKPLYLFRPASGGLLFASEVRTLLAAGPELVPPKVSAAAVEGFLAQGAVPGRRAIVEGVELLAPGTSLIVDWSGREVRRTRYWSLAADAAPPAEPAADRPAAVAALGQTLREAVKLRLISDVPLGLFLSGGIDSGALAAVATEVSGTKVRTLSVGFNEAAFDETDTAAAVARALGTDHTAVPLTGEQMLADIPAALAAVDQPSVDGFNTFIVSRAARQAGLTVALSGLGGDELFGGYPSFRDVPRAGRWQTAGRLLGPLRHAVAAGLRAVGRRATTKAAELIDRPADLVHYYLLRRELFLPAERRALHPPPAGTDPYTGLPADTLAELGAATADPDPVTRVSRLELTGYMGDMLLRDSDVFSMASGIELRVPLLDHKLVEQVVRLPGRWKRPDPRPKPLLIDAVGPRLPEVIRRLPKKGFSFPWPAWLAGPLRARVAAAVGDRDVWAGLGFDPSGVAAVWDRFAAGDRRVTAAQPMAFLVLHDYLTRHGLQP